MAGMPLLMGDNTVPGAPMPKELKELIPTIFRICTDFGLDYYPTVVQLLTYDEISEVAAYGGFPVRYPHWQWGMEYEELQRGYEYGMHKIYEMVINSNPCYLYCLHSNTLIDNITVIAHALGHNHFFKNNIFFGPTQIFAREYNMIDELANHGNRIREYMNRWGKERVTEFIDHILRIDTLIDATSAWDEKEVRDVVIRDARTYRQPRRLKVDQERNHMEDWINPREWKDQEKKRIDRQEASEELGLFDSPIKDVMGFMRNNAPFKPWQADIFSMLYEESLYFSPQGKTKITNEGFACLSPGSRLFTNRGVLLVEEVCNRRMEVTVNDGENNRNIVNHFVFEGRNTVTLKTRRGYTLSGSHNHRVWDENKNWIPLSSIEVGQKLQISRGADLWSETNADIDYISVDCSIDVLRRYRQGSFTKKNIDQYDNSVAVLENSHRVLKEVILPTVVTSELGSFLGYLVGYGCVLGITTADEQSVEDFVRLSQNLFGITPIVKKVHGKYRVKIHSRSLERFLVHLGLKIGVSARQKTIPECVLRSRKEVVSAFLRSYFDCDGHGGSEGVILSTSSVSLADQTQLLLLNYGILTSRHVKAKDNFYVCIRGYSVKTFFDQIGFGLDRKRIGVQNYIANRRFQEEKECDEVVSVEKGFGTVYDISVPETHRYSAQGFMNHNSWVDFNIMARMGNVSLGQKEKSSGIIEYADHKMGVLGGKYSTNPYKLGFSILQDIEERWDKGQFGYDWDNCTDMKKQAEWDTKAMLGKQKVFEVCQNYDDAMLIAEFFTEDLCRRMEFFTWKHYPNGDTKFEDVDYLKIKQKLMSRSINRGLPDIRLVDSNHRGKGHMLLQDFSVSGVLHESYVREVLVSLRALWGNDVLIATKNKDSHEIVYHCHGQDSEKGITVTNREKYDHSGS